jgi:trehalose 6-phosphate phosphatase
MAADRLPPFGRTALLLDLDGTLVDIAPRPEAVVVEPGLTQTLTSLRRQLADALAVVSGRPAETVDALLSGAPYAVAGEHGAALRAAPGKHVEYATLPPVPDDWRRAAAQMAAARPGVLLEHKAHGFTLHFRAIPDAGPMLRAELGKLLQGQCGFTVLSAHMAWEVRPNAADKGRAVEALMARPPFLGRLPLFIGDDVTDEDAIRATRGLGGAGLKVDAAFGTAAAVRTWLRHAATTGTWPELPLCRTA